VPPYLVVAGLLAALLAVFLARVLRPWCMRWGATAEERGRSWPGDELIPAPRCHCMHCITIDAPPEQVWRWLIQTGQDRAGFYSYDWIERLFGYDMRNADRIHPEWQQLAVGDRVRLHQATTPLEVVHLVEGRVVVLAGGRRLQDEPIRDPSAMRLHRYEAYTWSWFLEPVEGGGTRFIAWLRASWDEAPRPGLWHWLFVEPAHFIMQRGMHRGLKARVEEERVGTHAAQRDGGLECSAG